MKHSKVYSLLFILSIFGTYSFSQQGDCVQSSYCDRACWDSFGTHPTDATPSYTTPTHIIIHHAPLQTGSNYQQIVRSIWNYHVNTAGWDDIGYNWLVGGDGVLYKGRGDGIQGAHFSGSNSNTMGVCVLGGDFDNTSPTNAAIDTLKNLISWEATDKNINVLTSGYHNSGQNLYHISGHRDHNSSSTQCPGNNLYSLISSIRTDISNFTCYNGNNSNCNSPTNLNITNITETASTFNWALSNADGYEIELRQGNGSWNPIASAISATQSWSLSGLTAQINYEVRIKGLCSGVEESNWVSTSFTTAGSNGNPPPNDDCNNAIQLTSNTSCNSQNGTVADTTPSVGANNCLGCSCTSPDNYDVYYKFAAVSTSHTVTVSNYASNFDAVIELRISCSSGSSNYISCYDPIGTPSSVSETWNNLNIGQTYYIRVFEWNYSGDPPSSSTFDICVTHSGSSGNNSEDITVTNVTVAPSSVNSGDEITVSANQNYSGNQLDSDMPSFRLGYYLSTDCTLSSDDILLGTDSSGLGSDDPTNSETETVTIPSETSSGNYYIIFSADNDNELNESNENNNVACGMIMVSSSGNNSEDITVTNVTVTPSSVNSGDEITVSANQNYSGNQLDSDMPSFRLGYYLSTDCTLSSDDILLGTDSSGLGSDDPTNSETETVTIPSETSSGNYYIIFSADNDNELNESNENNNIECVPITINDSLGVDDNELNNKIKVYPNPTDSFLNIKLPNRFKPEKTTIQLYNINGRLITHRKPTIQDNQISIDTHTLSDGVYLLLLKNDNQKWSKLFIKK